MKEKTKSSQNSECCYCGFEEPKNNNFKQFDYRSNGLFIMHHYTPNAQSAHFNKHFHEDYEIIFFIDVHGEYIIENHKYNISPGDMLLIKPSKYHYLQVFDCNYERIVFNIEPELLGGDIVKRAFSNGEFFHLDSLGAVATNFHKIIEYYHTFPEKEFLIMVKALLTESLLLIEQFDKSDNDDEFKHLDEFNASVIKYIRENLTSIRSLEQMASDLYVSKSTLYHSFKKSMKISIMQYVRNKKVLHAQKLMRNGVKPTKACSMSGFDDYTTFYRSYKLFFGRSPGENEK